MFSLPPQIFINGLIAGSLYAMIALGLSLSYGILKFVNFAHAEMATLGAYIFLMLEILGIQIPLLSAVMTIIIVGFLGIILQKLTFKPIRKAASHTPMLASIGVAIALQQIVNLFGGSQIRTLNRDFMESYTFWNDRIFITNLQIIIITCSIFFMLALFAILKYTRTGKAIRAVADNSEAAAIAGINPEKIISIIFFMASALGAVAGILIGYQQNLSPYMGTALIVKAFTAVIIGGIGNIPGAIIGGYLLGILENLAIGMTINGFSVPASYKDAVTFVLLILVLLLRPSGLFGSGSEREA